MSSKVHFELKELYPVGGLRAECSAQGHITNIKNTCWSPEDKLPSVQGPVLLEVLVQLNDGPAESVRDPDQQEECNPETCADKHTSRQLSAWTATALSHVLERVGTSDVWIKHTTLSCKVSALCCVHVCTGLASAIQQLAGSGTLSQLAEAV